MVLGGDVAGAQSRAGAVRRVRRCQVQAFDHYSNGGGTWVSRQCMYVYTHAWLPKYVCMHMCAHGYGYVCCCTTPCPYLQNECSCTSDVLRCQTVLWHDWHFTRSLCDALGQHVP